VSDLSLSRGDLVTAVFGRDDGKRRPAVVVQSDTFNRTHMSVVLCPISSEITGLHMFRILLRESETQGLRNDSEVMVDKMGTVERSRIRQRVGRLSPAQMARVDGALRAWLDLPARVSLTGNNP
jgi:mRNA interferase MazF